MPAGKPFVHFFDAYVPAFIAVYDSGVDDLPCIDPAHHVFPGYDSDRLPTS